MANLVLEVVGGKLIAKDGLISTEINTLAKLNAIVADATLIDTGDSRLSDARTPTAHNHVDPIGFAIGDETSDIEVGVGVISFQMPNYATTLQGVGVNLRTPPTGSVATFDVNEAGVSVLSTKITIDAGETTSETAATAPVISDSAIAANAIITVDIDTVGSTIAGAGGKIWLYVVKA